MKKARLFNPENDVALGLAPGARYTMSRPVARLHDDGALLPWWLADDGDVVIARDADRDWLAKMGSLFGRNISVVREAGGLEGAPWGWSDDAVRQLTAAGATIPSWVDTGKLRKLSHRRITIDIMRRLHEPEFVGIPPIPLEVTDEKGVLDALERCGAVYVKQPWSSSGRGVRRISNGDDLSWLNPFIRRQGSALVEPALDKVRDFAMLFYSTGSRVERLGYSLFFTGDNGAYAGNLMADDRVLEDHLVAAGASREMLHRLSCALCDILASVIAPYYRGYFGIDMMVLSDGSIAPCVEVNLRMTMGVVAHLWRQRYLAPGCQAVYRVEYSPEGIADDCEISDGHLAGGRIALTPAASHGGFSFYVEVVFPGLKSLELLI